MEDWVECNVEGCTVLTPNGDCISCNSLRMAREAREANRTSRVDYFESPEARELFRRTGRAS